MIDFHSHFLPYMDDGSRSLEESYAMLRESARQGVTLMVATPHFYPTRETPESFIKRRSDAFDRLCLSEDFPKILLGAEVAYFHSISRCESLKGLNIAGTDLLLLEMPFEPWTNSMVEDVCAVKKLTGFTPVLAHYERYRRFPGFTEHLARMRSAGILVQSNAENFINIFGSRRAVKAFLSGEIDFVGSDCHNMSSRAPNMACAVKKAPQILEIDLSQYLTASSENG